MQKDMPDDQSGIMLDSHISGHFYSSGSMSRAIGCDQNFLKHMWKSLLFALRPTRAMLGRCIPSPFSYLRNQN